MKTRKNNIRTIALLVVGLCFCLVNAYANNARTKGAVTIDHVDPPCWWIGMRNAELQILMHGDGISQYQFSVTYPGVTLKEVVRVDSPNYLFIYLNVSDKALPGVMNLTLTDDRKKTTVYPFELKVRNKKPGALGFNTSDVLYLIMPDRFANGDYSNDTLEQARVNRQRSGARHGGDVRGVIDHLPYLKDLGVTAVWLNPVVKNNAGTYHGYAITDFYAVDPRYGKLDEYIEMNDKIHAQGMKVVMDMIFNHCGSSHWWLEDLPCKDWLNFDNTFVQSSHSKWTVMDPHASATEKRLFTDGWFNRGMPDLNQRNRHMAVYLIQNSIWWIEETRIDAIRQDTHPYADYEFMSRWCKEVMDEYPDFNIVGETWYPVGSSFTSWWQRDGRISDKNSNLKTIMDFNLTFICQDAFSETNKNAENHSSGLFRIYESLAQDFLYEDQKNILVFLDNHDLSRFCQDTDEGLNKFKQGMAFLLTTRGIPQLYYGTELAMSGNKNRGGDGAVRADFPGGWKDDAQNAFTPEGRTPLQYEAFNYLRKLLHWRAKCPTIHHGELIHYAPVGTNCYVYARIWGNQTVLVILNGSDKDENLLMNRYSDVLAHFTKGKDVISDAYYDITSELAVPARGVFVMELE